MSSAVRNDNSIFLTMLALRLSVNFELPLSFLDLEQEDNNKKRKRSTENKEFFTFIAVEIASSYTRNG